ncbi:MAG: DUF1398 family protein [Ginsengibacter sp.]
MFTIEQIVEAHSKVKSGVDFPKYIQQLKQLGVTDYETWVVDSHTGYFGENKYQTTSDPLYEQLEIADTSNKEKFVEQLKIHQQGKTDYLTFCKGCAEAGIEKWFARLDMMTCTYYDKAGNEILVQQIPQ